MRLPQGPLWEEEGSMYTVGVALGWGREGIIYPQQRGAARGRGSRLVAVVA